MGILTDIRMNGGAISIPKRALKYSIQIQASKTFFTVSVWPFTFQWGFIIHLILYPPSICFTANSTRKSALNCHGCKYMKTYEFLQLLCLGRKDLQASLLSWYNGMWFVLLTALHRNRGPMTLSKALVVAQHSFSLPPLEGFWDHYELLLPLI